MANQMFHAAAALAVATFPAFAATEVLTFESFDANELITTVGKATYSSDTRDVQVYRYESLPDYAQSGVNTIGPAGYGLAFYENLYVDFAVPVWDLSFFSGADDNAGVQATINVHEGGVFAGVVPLIGDGDPTPDLHDLSGFTNVTRIEIVDVTDPGGIVYDDFSYTYARGDVPLPAGGWLLLSALAVMGLRRLKCSV